MRLLVFVSSLSLTVTAHATSFDCSTTENAHYKIEIDENYGRGDVSRLDDDTEIVVNFISFESPSHIAVNITENDVPYLISIGRDGYSTINDLSNRLPGSSRELRCEIDSL